MAPFTGSAADPAAIEQEELCILTSLVVGSNPAAITLMATAQAKSNTSPVNTCILDSSCASFEKNLRATKS